MTPTKARLRDELHAQLTRALATARDAHAAAIEGATHPEARAENDKDTRGLEQSYLARGQAQRVADLEAALGSVAAMVPRGFGPEEAIALGAVVEVLEDDATRCYFLAPGGGGCVLEGGIRVITPDAPLGRALLGKHVDDAIELQLAGRARTLEIVAVR